MDENYTMTVDTPTGFVEDTFVVIDYKGVNPDLVLQMDGMRITMRELHEFLSDRDGGPKFSTIGISG